MKGGLIIGAIAGLIGGLFTMLPFFITISLGIYEIPPIPMERFGVAMIVLSIIAGAVLGIIYSMFYDSIPGKNAMKGLYFGLIIFVICIVADWLYIAFMLGMTPFIIGSIIIEFFYFVVYGIALGYYYKK